MICKFIWELVGLILLNVEICIICGRQAKGQSDNKEGTIDEFSKGDKVLVLHIASPSFISATTCDPLNIVNNYP